MKKGGVTPISSRLHCAWSVPSTDAKTSRSYEF